MRKPKGIVFVGAALLALCALLVSGTSFAAAFAPGNVVVVRVGTGAAVLSSAAQAVFLDEYTTAGTFVQSVALPTAVSGSNRQLTLGGLSTSEGGLSLSVNGSYLVLAGYAADPGTAGPAAATAATVNRVVGRIDGTAAIDTSTALTDANSAVSIRSAATVDGTAFWTAGANEGERYATLGATTSTVVSSTITNLRVTNVYGGQLYVSNGSGTNARIQAVGTGLPTTTGQTMAGLPGFPTTGSAYGFFFADLDAGVAGYDTLYVADDSAGLGIQKYSLVGGNWTANGTVTAASARGLAGRIQGGNVQLFATTGASVAAGGGTLYTYTDTTGYNGTLTAQTASSIATAATNTSFRGVAFTPGTVVPVELVGFTAE